MTSDQEKKRWRFSLAHAMTAITVICITLATTIALAKEGSVGDSVVVILAGLCSTIGVFQSSTKGAIIDVGWGFVIAFTVVPLLVIFVLAIGAFFN